jgi:ATP-dependent Clp protease ATP-binding subunit ClpA
MILIMTSNVGARDMNQTKLGFGDRTGGGEDDKAFKNLFSPEFRNRLDARIGFASLSPTTIKSVVEKFVRELGAQLADRDVTVELTDEAKAYLADKGYDKAYGARPLGRLIDQEIKRALSDELLFGSLEHGGHVLVGHDGQKLTFVYTAKPKEEEPARAAKTADEGDGRAASTADEGDAKAAKPRGKGDPKAMN